MSDAVNHADVIYKALLRSECNYRSEALASLAAMQKELEEAKGEPVCLCDFGQQADPDCPHHGIGSPDHFALMERTITTQAERLKELESTIAKLEAENSEIKSRLNQTNEGRPGALI